MVKLFAFPSAMTLIGIMLGVDGHMSRKKEVIILGTAYNGLKDTFKFYRKNVVDKEGVEADLSYLRGTMEKKEVLEKTVDANNNDIVIKQEVPVVKNRPKNPWRFEYSPTFFRSATGNPQTDITHLLQVQDYFQHVYMGRKKFGDISNYEILEYLDPIWEAIDADGSVKDFCRNNGYGHDIHGDDCIDLGVYRAINDAAIKGTGDVVYIELNSDGPLKSLRNRYLEKYRGRA